MTGRVHYVSPSTVEVSLISNEEVGEAIGISFFTKEGIFHYAISPDAARQLSGTLIRAT